MNFWSFKGLFAFVSIIAPLISCREDESSAILKTDCSLKELQNRVETIETKNGRESSLEIRGAILANIKKIINLEGESRWSKKEFDELISSVRTDSLAYSSKFLEIHNSLVQIMCSIERNLADPTLSDSMRVELQKSLNSKRDKYFDLIIDLNTTFSENSNTKINDYAPELRTDSKPNKRNISSSKISNKEKLTNDVKTYTLAIMTSPSNATITIDGKFFGMTNREISLEAGEYVLELEKKNYALFKDIVFIPKQKIISISLEREFH